MYQIKNFAAILLVVLILTLPVCGASENKDVINTDTHNPNDHNDLSEVVSKDKLKQVELNTWRSAVLTESGDLYLWGDYSYTRSDYPTKVMEGVETVRLGRGHNAAITKDKSLYMWGHNNFKCINTEEIYLRVSYYCGYIC